MNIVQETKQKTETALLFKRLAVFSVCLYVIFSAVFDSVESNLSILSSLSIYVCIACCALYVISRGSVKIIPLSLILSVLAVFFVISALYSPASRSLITTYLYRFITSVILIILVSNAVTEWRDAETVINAFVAAGVILSLYVYFTYGITSLSESVDRIDEQLGNQNNLGLICAFSIIFSVYKMMCSRKLGKLVYAAATVVCLPAVMLSGSRKAVLIIVVALAVFFLTYNKNRMLLVRILIVAGVLALIVLVIYKVPAFQAIEDRFDSFFDVLKGEQNTLTSESDARRNWYVQEGLKAFGDSPLWGNGFFYSHYRLGVYSHNNYVELLMNGGLIAFALFYSIHVCIASNIVKMIKNNVERKRIALIIMILAALLVSDIGVVTYYNRFLLVIMSLCFVSFANTDEKNNETEAKQ